LITVCGAVALTLVTCESGTSPEPSTISKVAGDGQQGTAGEAVAVAPRVRVLRGQNRPVSGAAVEFNVASGGGSITGGSATTDAQGEAAVGAWILGDTSGENSLEATLVGVTTDAANVVFTATAGAGAAALLEKADGDAQSATVGQAVAKPPRIRLMDRFRNPVAGNAVTFQITGGNGSLTAPTQSTGADGTAAPSTWQLGTVAGENAVKATATGSGITGNPATFAATGLAAAAAAIELVEGNGQTGLTTRPVTVRPKVRLRDMFGNGVPGVLIDWAIASGGGTIDGAVGTSATDGTAAVTGWTLGPAPGTNTMSATARAPVTGNPIVFTATARALFNALQFAGTWDGTWSDFTLGTTGTSHLVIAVDDVAKTVSITLSSSGPTLGNPGGAPEQTKISPYGDGGLDLHVTAAVYGDVSIRVDGDGKIDGAGTGLQSKGIDCWEIDGTVTGTQFVIDWVIYYLDDTEQRGRIVLNR
jgi:hypothetical protein